MNSQRKLDEMNTNLILIGEWNVDRLYFFMNFSKVEEIKKHEDDPGQRHPNAGRARPLP